MQFSSTPRQLTTHHIFTALLQCHDNTRHECLVEVFHPITPDISDRAPPVDMMLVNTLRPPTLRNAKFSTAPSAPLQSQAMPRLHHRRHTALVRATSGPSSDGTPERTLAIVRR